MTKTEMTQQTRVDMAEVPYEEFGKESLTTTCRSCHYQVTTKVESNVNTSGWVFAILCCCCGSWLVSLLVLCLPGFRKFSHHCSRCGALVGVGHPRHSTGQIVLIVLLSLLALALVIGFAVLIFSG